MNIQLETVTPLHIGSGEQLHGNAEYLYFKDQNQVVILDESKVLDIIGVSEIHTWINYIDGDDGSFLDYLRRRKPQLQPTDIAKRILALRGKVFPQKSNTLRIQLHNGMGKPYLPGSSLKGAIRTAVFATSLLENSNSLSGVDLNKKTTFGKTKFDHVALNRKIFGNNPNADWFRMLQVSDAYFECTTRATFAHTLNQQYSLDDFKYKDKVKQLIEYIPSDSSTNLSIRVPKDQLDLIFRMEPDLFPNKAKKFSVDDLFRIINHHTIRLLDNEITYFREKNIENAEDWLHKLVELSEYANTLNENQCLIRVGFGTGYLSMTGDWLDDKITDNDLFYEVGTAVRRKPGYDGYKLPKSRKMLFEGTPLGFVKLTIQ